MLNNGYRIICFISCDFHFGLLCLLKMSRMVKESSSIQLTVMAER